MTDNNEIKKMMGNKEGASTTTTVRFNVGGTVHVVSRSLLLEHENSMLAKASSKTWQSNPDMAIFIDGDGERFRYCLDFMRHGQVHLPVNILKAAVLQDLDYYGIQVPDPSLIDGSCASLDAAAHIAKKKEEHSKALSVYNDKMRKLEHERSCFVVAYAYYVYYSDTGSLDDIRLVGEDEDVVQTVLDDRTLFDKFLAEHGLHYIKHHYRNSWRVTLGKLPEKKSPQS